MGSVSVTIMIWATWAGMVSGYYTPMPTDQQEEYCECVRYYLCIDGVISTSGGSIISPRTIPVTNVKNCPHQLDVCCKPPPPPTTASTPTSTLQQLTPVPILPPDTPCDCIPFRQCYLGRVVSDGGGKPTLEFFGIEFSHSKCSRAYFVCCASEITTTTTMLSPQSVCVMPHLCNVTGYVIDDGSNLLDWRSTPSSQCECPDPDLVCCLLPEAFEDIATTPTTMITTASVSSSTIVNTPTAATPTQPPLPTTTTQEPSTCGIRNFVGVEARIHGFLEGESQFGEFPWVVMLLYANNGRRGYSFTGGGTLIHPQVILTAAHKVNELDAHSLVVRVGEWDVLSVQEPYSHKDIPVARIVVHPHYNSATLVYDVALLILQEEVKLGPHIDILCLAEDLDVVNHSSCIISGWGNDDEGKSQRIMKSLTLPLVGHHNCMNSLRKTHLGPYFRLDQSFLCAGGEEGKDACKGDGGGPLACPLKNGEREQYLLVGITAWGVECGKEGIPGVYVNVPELSSWITATMDLHLQPTTVTTTTTHISTASDEEETNHGQQARKSKRQQNRAKIRKGKKNKRKRRPQRN